MNGEGLARLENRGRLPDQAFCDGEWNDLDRRRHVAAGQLLVFGDGRNGDHRVDTVEPPDRRGVDHGHAGRFGDQVHTAGEGVGVRTERQAVTLQKRDHLAFRHVSGAVERHVLDEVREAARAAESNAAKSTPLNPVGMSISTNCGTR